MACSRCKDLPKELQCIQDIYVEKKVLDKRYIGCGVSLAPPKDVTAVPVSVNFLIIVYFIIFSKVRNRADSIASFEPRPILHPDELGLKPIICKDEVIDRCGSMLFKIYDQHQPTIMVSKLLNK